MEKIKFELPEAELILFENEDVVTASGDYEPEYGDNQTPIL